jgi:tRNA(Arg) A34 adenosine deaminase TadA
MMTFPFPLDWWLRGAELIAAGTYRVKVSPFTGDVSALGDAPRDFVETSAGVQFRAVNEMTSVVIAIPSWVDEIASAFDGSLDTEDGRMALTIALSRHNVERGGGPFGATVFMGAQLIAAGVNLVLDSGLTITHAEIVAMMRAQRALIEVPRPIAGPYSLVASTEPCCQCFGALVWSGIGHLTCGANTSDAEAVGFDEGPKPEAWVQSLEARGISVTQGIRREEARAVLDEYVRRGGVIYGRHASPPA